MNEIWLSGVPLLTVMCLLRVGVGVFYELDIGRLMSKRAAVIGTTLRARPPENKAVICASTGNTSASAAAYAVRAGLTCAV